MALRLKQEQALALRWVSVCLLKTNATACLRKVGSWVPPLGGTNAQRGTLPIANDLVPMPPIVGRAGTEGGTVSSSLCRTSLLRRPGSDSDDISWYRTEREFPKALQVHRSTVEPLRPLPVQKTASDQSELRRLVDHRSPLQVLSHMRPMPASGQQSIVSAYRSPSFRIGENLSASLAHG